MNDALLPGKREGGMKSEMGRAAYWRMNYETAIQALADLIAENTENVDLLKEAVERIRHDHAYPMEVGPHHCDGCDLEAKIKAALPTVIPSDVGNSTSSVVPPE